MVIPNTKNATPASPGFRNRRSSGRSQAHTQIRGLAAGAPAFNTGVSAQVNATMTVRKKRFTRNAIEFLEEREYG